MVGELRKRSERLCIGYALYMGQVLKKRDAENRKAAADAQAALAMKLLADEGFELEDDSSPSEMLQLKGKETKTPGMLDA